MTQLQKNDVATNDKPMTVDVPDLRLQGVRARLKCGEYDGTDIMAAWIAIDELLAVQAELAEQRAELSEGLGHACATFCTLAT